MTTNLIKCESLRVWFIVFPYEGTGQPEGPGHEWRSILDAMKERKTLLFRRIGVTFDDMGNAWFWSPRNSINRWAASVPAAEVDAWITEAEKILVS